MTQKNFDINQYSEEELSSLPDRERDILIRYYFQKETLSTIAQFYNLTDSRIGQLRKQGQKRLRGLKAHDS